MELNQRRANFGFSTWTDLPFKVCANLLFTLNNPFIEKLVSKKNKAKLS